MPALSGASSAEPERMTRPNATVGIPRRSTCRMLRPLSSRALLGTGAVKEGCAAAAGMVLALYGGCGSGALGFGVDRELDPGLAERGGGLANVFGGDGHVAV